MAKDKKPFGNLKKGALHSDLGIKQGEKIPVSRLKSAANSSNETLRKRAQFALNARSFAHPKGKKK